MRALKIYRDEIDRTLALIGCPTIAELDRNYVIMPTLEDAAALD